MSEKLNRRCSLAARRHGMLRLAAGSAVVALGLSATDSFGQTLQTWDGTTGSYNLATNWNPDVTPSNLGNQFLTINNGGTAQVVTGDTAEGAFLYLGLQPGDSGHLTINGGTMTLGEMRVGGVEVILSDPFDNASTPTPNGGGTGTVVQNGGTVNLTYFDGLEPPRQSLWIGDAGLASGNTANGSYTITGTVSAPAVLLNGTANNDGIFIGTGVGTIGAFTQNAFTTVTSTGFINIGRRGATGTYTMNGGTLNAQAGTGTALFVGDGDTGGVSGTNGTFTQTGGTVSVSGAAIVGRRNGEGSYSISAGSLTTSAELRIGDHGSTDPALGNGKGTMTVSGTGAITVGTNLHVGIGSASVASNVVGTLNQTGGSISFSAADAIWSVGNGQSATGTANISGGTLTLTGATSELDIGRFNGKGSFNISGTANANIRQILVGGNGSATNLNSGTLNVTGGTLTAGNITLVSASPAAPSSVVREANFSGGTTTLTTFNNGTTAGGGVNMTRTTNISGTADVAIGTVTLGLLSNWNITGGTTKINTMSTNTGMLYISGGNNTIASGAFPGILTLNSNSTLKTENAITLASTIQMGSVAVNVVNGSLSLTGPITSGTAQTMTKSGPGTLTISGAQSHVNNSAITNGSGGGILNLNANGGTNLGINANSGTTNFGAAQILRQMTVNSGATLNVGAFNASTTSAVTLNTGTLTGTSGVVSGGSFVAQNGTISAILGGTGALAKNSANTVTLTRANSYAGGTNVNAGTLVVGNASALGTGAVTVTDSTLRIQSGLPTAVNANALTLAGTGTVDMTDGAMIIKTGGNLATIAAAVASAATIDLTWTGTGITSTVAANDPNGITAVGFATGADYVGGGLTDFVGVEYDDDDILIRTTYYGDSDLNGDTNLDDYPLFIFGLEDPIAPQTWYYGDYNYSGEVDIDDFPLFIAGLENDPIQTAALADLIEMSSISADNKSAMLGMLAAVPEPTTLALLGAAACGGLLRRRRAN